MKIAPLIAVGMLLAAHPLYGQSSTICRLDHDGTMTWSNDESGVHCGVQTVLPPATMWEAAPYPYWNLKVTNPTRLSTVSLPLDRMMSDHLWLRIVSCTNPMAPVLTNMAINATVSGRVTNNELWCGSILITGDIEVDPGVTLTIAPGTLVQFTAQNDDRHRGPTNDMAEYGVFPDDPPCIPAHMIELDVSGTLEARGTPLWPIIFTSNSNAPALNDWQSICILTGGTGIFDHIVMEYNYWGIQMNGSNAWLSMSNSTVRHIATGGIIFSSNLLAQSVAIRSNVFTRCHHEGVGFFGFHTNVIVERNCFFSNEVGIVVDDAQPRITENVFKGNKRGLGLYRSGASIVSNEIRTSSQAGLFIKDGASLAISNNNIHDNLSNVTLFNTTQDVTAADNWWGTTNPAAIEALIQDHADDTNLGTVAYVPFATNAFL